MFDKILVAVDRSQFGKLVFEAALEFAKVSQGQMKLLHILALDEPDNPTISISTGIGMAGAIDQRTQEICQELWQTYEEKGLELLRSFAAQAEQSGIKAEMIQYGGSPGQEICALSRDWNTNLIVLGRRGGSGVRELLLGSVSNYVLHHAPCSVLIVQ